jgi:hypothetical protein
MVVAICSSNGYDGFVNSVYFACGTNVACQTSTGHSFDRKDKGHLENLTNPMTLFLQKEHTKYIEQSMKILHL